MSETIFDPKAGLVYLGNDEDAYMEVLQMYVAKGPEKKERLSELLQKKDWKDYIIEAHALKSTSLSIGAEGLSLLAKELELSGKEGNYSVIEEKHDSMLEKYDSVLCCVKEYLESKSASGKKAANQHNMIVLVIDEVKENLVCAKKALSELYKVICAPSSNHATEYLKNNKPDAVILDVKMTDVYEKIRSQDTTKDIPVIFLTTTSDEETRNKYISMGAIGIIDKPLSLESLKTKVTALLS